MSVAITDQQAFPGTGHRNIEQALILLNFSLFLVDEVWISAVYCIELSHRAASVKLVSSTR